MKKNLELLSISSENLLANFASPSITGEMA